MVKFYVPVYHGEKSVVPAHTYVNARVYSCATLTHNYSSSPYLFAAVSLNSESLAVAIATVLG